MKKLAIFLKRKTDLIVFLLTNLSRLSIELGIKSQKLHYVDQGIKTQQNKKLTKTEAWALSSETWIH